MKALIDLVSALTPFITAATPVLLVLVGWWVNKQNKKTAAQQTDDLKSHSDDNRELIKSAVKSVQEP